MPNGKYWMCEVKRNAYNRNYYAGRSRFGLPRNEVARVAAEQGGACASCGKVDVKLVRDHDHGTGEFRALLCGHCNFGLGHFFDDPELLELGAAYLRKHGK